MNHPIINTNTANFSFPIHHWIAFNNIHNFNVTGLFSAQEQEFTKNNVSGNDYYDDNIQYYNPGLAQGNVTGGGSYEKWGLLSYMGRLNYNYKEKYLLTATVRYDGSSRLADGNKWHAFPSVALGWNLMRENFMQNVNADVLSGMKLRLSWGNVGSTAISAYQTMSRLDTGSKYLLGTNGVMGVRPGSVPDKSLGWENTETWNIGVDFGFLNNRITGTIEWYQQNTTDLLLGVNLPSTSGYSQSYLTNRGATRNRGLEFNVTTVNIAGDGCFRMNMNELATASREKLPLIEVIINNHVLGMVRQWQTLFYEKHYSATVLDDGVDYVKLSEAMGATARRVKTQEEFEKAFADALKSKTPFVIDCIIDSDDKVWPMVAPGKPINESFDEEDYNATQGGN